MTKNKVCWLEWQTTYFIRKNISIIQNQRRECCSVKYSRSQLKKNTFPEISVVPESKSFKFQINCGRNLQNIWLMVKNFFQTILAMLRVVLYLSHLKKKRKIRKKFFEKENEWKDLNIMNKWINHISEGRHLFCRGTNDEHFFLFFLFFYMVVLSKRPRKKWWCFALLITSNIHSLNPPPPFIKDGGRGVGHFQNWWKWGGCLKNVSRKRKG